MHPGDYELIRTGSTDPASPGLAPDGPEMARIFRSGDSRGAKSDADDAPAAVPRRRLLRRPAASDYLRETWGIQRAPATLAKLACLGGGPRFHRAGRWPLYDPDHLDVWARELIGEAVASTSEAA